MVTHELRPTRSDCEARFSNFKNRSDCVSYVATVAWTPVVGRHTCLPEIASGVSRRMGCSNRREIGLSEQRKYRTFTAQQKLEIVLAGLRGDVTVKELCRSHEIAETLYYSWREKLLEGGREALAGKNERQGEKELKRRIGQLERALGRKTYELEVAGEALRGWE